MLFEFPDTKKESLPQPTKPKQRRDYEKEAEHYQRQYLGRRYEGVSLSQIAIPTWAQIKIADWIKKPKNFLVFLGNPGIGKTHLCASLFPFAIKNFRCFRYHNVRNLTRSIRESIGASSSDYGTVLKYLIDDDLIFIDDIGSERYSQFNEDIIFDMLDQRYNDELPTVITSNYSIKEFKEIYHKRVSSRLFGSENTVIEILDGVDFRSLPKEQQ